MVLRFFQLGLSSWKTSSSRTECAAVGCCSVLAWYLALYITGSEAVQAKLRGMVIAWFHFFLSRDRAWGSVPDAQDVLVKAKRTGEADVRRVYFIRHGESCWNEVFNKGFGISFPFRLIRGILRELVLLPSPDSLFWDSPLSLAGLQQVTQLLTWIESAPLSDTHAQILKGDPAFSKETALSTSNLRRSVSTALCSLSSRLLRAANQHEKVHVLSSLQEITRNVDGYSLAPEGMNPTASWVERDTASLSHIVDMYEGKNPRLDSSFNHGSKALSVHGLSRFRSFCDWCFTSQPCKEKKIVIAAGHSLYFKEFFNVFLPKSSTHKCKKLKMVNCGVVCFDLVKVGTNFAVIPESVEAVYGGFEGENNVKNPKN